jgi:hypothetical protein
MVVIELVKIHRLSSTPCPYSRVDFQVFQVASIQDYGSVDGVPKADYISNYPQDAMTDGVAKGFDEPIAESWKPEAVRGHGLSAITFVSWR